MVTVDQILYILFLAALPVVEARGSVPYGILTGIDVPTVVALSIVGNLAPVPFLLLFLCKIEGWVMGRSDGNPVKRLFIKYIERLRRTARSKVERYGFWGLMIFVIVPLPGTGAWTGSAVAYLFGIENKRAFASIALGVVGAVALLAVAFSVFGLVL